MGVFPSMWRKTCDGYRYPPIQLTWRLSQRHPYKLAAGKTHPDRLHVIVPPCHSIEVCGV